MVQKCPFLLFLTFSQTKTVKTDCFFSHNAIFITLKCEISHVLAYYHDEYTQPITAKYFLAMLRHFHERK
jgi:hypothetical protein